MHKYFALTAWMLLAIFGLGVPPQQQVQPVSGVLTLNLVPGTSSFKVILSANVTSVVIQNPTPGTIISVIFTENATGGFLVTFGGNIANPCIVATAANTTTTCQFQYDATSNTWNGIGGSGSGGTPGGSNAQLQYNNNGAFGGTTATWDTANNRFRAPDGNAGAPTYGFTTSAGDGWFHIANQSVGLALNSATVMRLSRTVNELAGDVPLAWPSSFDVTSAADTGLSRMSAGVLGVGNGTFQNTGGGLQAGSYLTGSNCSSSASPAVCGSAAAGSVVIAAAATTVQVNTTAVTANSQILLTRDDSLGTKLSVTCNTATVMGEMKVSARTAGTNFTITVQTTPATNPGCISYSIMN